MGHESCQLRQINSVYAALLGACYRLNCITTKVHSNEETNANDPVALVIVLFI